VAPLFTGDPTFMKRCLKAAREMGRYPGNGAARGTDRAGHVECPKSPSISTTPLPVINEQISHNVVGMIEGSDPVLKDTYVMFGAHLDHIGYSQTGAGGEQVRMPAVREVPRLRPQ
jgi:hypothetical protein